jgi:hypothetical protein
MNRKHLILPAALLAGSALLDGRAAIGELPLGSDAQPASSVGQLVETTSTDDIGTRSAQLDAAERRLNALDAQVPPALPGVPAPPVRVASSGPSANSGPSSAARTGDDNSGRDHAEDDGSEDDDDAFDDHGGDRDDDGGDDDEDDHGGSDDD